MRCVVLGTGTEVGKTYVTVELARSLAEQGASVVALKPVETGVRPNAPNHVTDAGRLSAVSLHVKRSQPRYSLRDGVSPHLAARREETTIDIDEIIRWIEDIERTALQAMSPYSSAVTLIETAGGVLSPLTDAQTNLDLATALDPARWILVAPDSLGVLHDVRATCTAMEALARAPDYLVLSGARSDDGSTGSNAAELGRVGSMTPSAVVHRGSTGALRDLTARLLET